MLATKTGRTGYAGYLRRNRKQEETSPNAFSGDAGISFGTFFLLQVSLDERTRACATRGVPAVAEVYWRPVASLAHEKMPKQRENDGLWRKHNFEIQISVVLYKKPLFAKSSWYEQD